jgi:hypothetical protein
MPPVRVTVAATPSGAAIAADGRRYDGQGYVYGGNASAPGVWDCSSFASYVLGHDLNIGLPGGRWGGPGMPPAVHGPVVMSYVTWAGADPVPAGQEQPGDLVCWPGIGAGGHMGIVLGPNQMVSALNSQLGTLISPIAGWGPTGQWVYRRVKGTGTAPAPAPGGAGGGGGWGEILLALLAGAAVGGAAILAVTGLAAAAAAGVMWLAVRAARGGGARYGAAV